MVHAWKETAFNADFYETVFMLFYVELADSARTYLLK